MVACLIIFLRVIGQIEVYVLVDGRWRRASQRTGKRVRNSSRVTLLVDRCDFATVASTERIEDFEVGGLTKEMYAAVAKYCLSASGVEAEHFVVRSTVVSRPRARWGTTHRRVIVVNNFGSSRSIIRFSPTPVASSLAIHGIEIIVGRTTGSVHFFISTDIFVNQDAVAKPVGGRNFR